MKILLDAPNALWARCLTWEGRIELTFYLVTLVLLARLFSTLLRHWRRSRELR
jgi:hypothetical protein